MSETTDDVIQQEGVHQDNSFTITHMGGEIGVLSWNILGAEVPARLFPVKKADTGWILARRKSAPISLKVGPEIPKPLAEVVALWKRIPIYELPKSILVGLYSHKVNSFQVMFGVRVTSLRPRIDLGTDKIVTRPGTFLIEDLLGAGIPRGFIKKLLDLNVFHLPKV